MLALVFLLAKFPGSRQFGPMKWLRSVTVSWALLAGMAGVFEGRALGAGKAEHVVMIVWDGMRPDFISPQYTPTLYDLALKGVYFKNHHSVFVTSTEVNGAALATGDYPNRHGIFANRLYWSDMNWLDSSATESLDVIRRGDALTAGHYIAVPTVTELLQQAGVSTVVAGTKPVAILLDRFQRRTLPAAQESVLLYAGHTIPSSASAQAVKVNDKEFPAAATPNKSRDAWTTKALTDAFWKKGVPKFSVLWLSEPDASQHGSGPGSDSALAGIESSDQCLAAVLKTLEEKKVLDKTDLFIVSDHAFSTVQRGVDLAETLKKARFKAASRFDDPEPGNVLIVGLGAAAAFYVIDRDEDVHRRLVQFLQGTDFAGVIFSRLPMPGTFPLAPEAHHPGTADLL